MNALLIHKNNLNTEFIDNFDGDKTTIDYAISINNPNFILDRFLHDELKKIFQGKNYDVIFIPYTLSIQNYLELTGLRIAAHIRLTKEWEHFNKPIVFIGPETKEQIAKLSELGTILFTPGVFSTTKYNVENIKKQYKWIKENQPQISEYQYLIFLKRYQFKPSANYQTHHSIDNDLTLMRWSEYLRCDNKISEVKEIIQKSLYFKYQKALKTIEPINANNLSLIINGKANVFLVEDEAEKGWKNFYECFFQNSLNITFDYLKYNYKASSQIEIIEYAINKIQELKPDVVLLDLRLCNADFKNHVPPEELTGAKIIKKIKEINKGIQVIIVSASNKIWNYQYLKNLGANGYIIKKGDSNVREDINNLKTTIETGIKRAVYLKPAWNLTKDMIKSLDKTICDNKIDKDLGLELIKLLNIAIIMYDNAQKKDDFAYAYLALYKCLELISNEFIKSCKTIYNYKWDDKKHVYNKDILPKKNNISTFLKIANLSFQLWGFDNDFVKKLYYSIHRRNKFIHPSPTPLKNLELENERKKIYEPEGYIKLLNQLSNIINKITK